MTIRQITFNGVGGLKAVPRDTNHVGQMKFDGSQYHLHIKGGKAYGLTSKRISKKTNVLSEKIDHFPNINDQKFKYTKETIIVVEVISEHLEHVKEEDRCTYVSGIMNSNADNLTHHGEMVAYEKGSEPKLNDLKMIAHDVIYFEGKDVRELGYQERTALLKGFKFAGKYGEKISSSPRSKTTVYRVENFEINEFPFDDTRSHLDTDEIQEWINENWKFEGLIFKDLFSNKMLKVKKLKTCDAIIIGYLPSKSDDKYKDMVGSLRIGLLQEGITLPKTILKSNDLDLDVVEALIKNGNIIEIATVSGFSEEWRKDFTWSKDEYMGSIVEVSYMLWTGSRLRHPRFEDVRYDKQIGRCTFDQVM